MKPSLRLPLLAAALLGVGTLLGMSLDTRAGDGADTARQLRKLQEAFVLISQQYVESVDADRLAESAIAGMLEELDPHSAYIAARDLREVQEGFEGSFGGVGIMFEIVADTARVITTIADGPSEKAGVQAGDRIVGIGDSTAVGFDDDDVRRHLKGEVGTPVRVTVARPGARAPLRFTLTRARIPIYTVGASFMVDDRTGYLRIDHFAQTTYDEFRQHLARLRGRGMQRLVLDLRDNPGGVMSSAVKIADEFLPAGEVIVSTRSRNPQFVEVDRATAGGSFEGSPVIVLVNAYSASAAEILAGALQDHDRALVVGQRTFGKGLVQTQFPLADGSVLQMTISRYFTPAGRLIQTPYEHGETQQAYVEQKFATRGQETFNPRLYTDRVPDSLKFRTDAGRVVFGGGGILPDVVVAPDTTSALLGVGRLGLDGDFARTLFTEQEQALRARYGTDPTRLAREFRLDDAAWARFIAFAQASDQHLTLTDDPSKVAPRQNVYLRSAFDAVRPDVEARIKAYLARNLFGSEQWYPLALPTDPTFREAARLWGQAEGLAAR